MKKIISIILTVVFTVMCLSTVAGATTLTSAQVDMAQQMYLAADESAASDITLNAEYINGKVRVTFSSDVLANETNPQATILIYDATNSSTPAAGNIIQIDQFAYDSANKSYSCVFEADAENSTIMVLMGGTGIDNIGQDELTIATVEIGNADGEGGVDIFDAVAVAQHSVGIITLTGDCLAAANVNSDNVVDIFDAVNIAQYAVGLVTSLPVL